MRNQQGFTLVEVVFVLMIGGILMGVGTREYARLSSQMAVGNARDAMIQTASRARGEAMRSGSLIYMHVRPDEGTVAVETAGGQVLHTLDAAEFGAQLAGEEISVCYTSRGYALPGCTTVAGVETVHFFRGADSAAVVVMALGQVRRAP